GMLRPQKVKSDTPAGFPMALPTPPLAHRVAVHEAGHAVASRLLRLPSGAAFLAPPHVEFAIDQGAASVCALMAGAIGEILHFGDYDRTGITVDWQRACARLGDSDGRALWDYTLDLLRPHAGLVKYVAVRLERARSLDGATLDAIVFRG